MMFTQYSFYFCLNVFTPRSRTFAIMGRLCIFFFLFLAQVWDNIHLLSFENICIREYLTSCRLIYRCRLSFLHQGKPPIAMFDVQNKQPHQKHCAYGMNIHIYLCAVRRIYSWILPHQFRYRTNTPRAFHIDVGRIYVQNRHERCDVFTCCLCS